MEGERRRLLPAAKLGSLLLAFANRLCRFPRRIARGLEKLIDVGCVSVLAGLHCFEGIEGCVLSAVSGCD